MTRGPTEASFKCSIAPWLSVRKSAQAVEFYKSAFGETEVYLLPGVCEWKPCPDDPYRRGSRCGLCAGSKCRRIGDLSRKRRARLADRTRGRSFRPSLGNWASACGLR